MGALWKVRANLNTALGNAAGDLVADTLMLSWFNAYDDGQIRSWVEDHWLALDDNDGNIYNDQTEVIGETTFVKGNEWVAGNLSYHMEKRPKWIYHPNNIYLCNKDLKCVKFK